MSNIHPTAIIDKQAQIASSVVVGAYSVIGPHVVIDDDCIIHPHVVIDGRTTIGKNCEIFSFACLGKAPQHLRYEGEPSELIIGDNNIIREHVTMHIGTKLGHMKTVIGNDGMFMASSHVAHDCVVGDHFILGQNAALGGHCEVADHVYFGAYSAAHQFVRVGHSAMIGGLTAVIADVIPYGNVYGERGMMQGLNLVGMRRRGMPKEEVRAIKAAYDALFLAEGIFKDNLEKVAQHYGDLPAVQDMITFIKADASRPLSLPKMS
ncbi:MAG: acyl-ACP--UDP-N-acetylglucosamine O-acyltransferase [Candidatus Puniceispirillaceae bacterium]